MVGGNAVGTEGRGRDGDARDWIVAALVEEFDVESAPGADEVVDGELVRDRVLEVGQEGLVNDIPVADLRDSGRCKE